MNLSREEGGEDGKSFSLGGFKSRAMEDVIEDFLSYVNGHIGCLTLLIRLQTHCSKAYDFFEPEERELYGIERPIVEQLFPKNPNPDEPPNIEQWGINCINYMDVLISIGEEIAAGDDGKKTAL